MGEASLLTRPQLEDLYESIGPRLFLYLERRTGDPALAADLVQDIFVRLLEAPLRWESPAEAKSYLYRAAHSRLVDHARRAGRERAWRMLSEQHEEARTLHTEPSDLERAFRTLNQRETMLLWLAYAEGMEHNEIANVLDLKTASVKVLLHRARGRLAHEMARLGLRTETTK